jgi:hypothetical protein
MIHLHLVAHLVVFLYGEIPGWGHAWMMSGLDDVMPGWWHACMAVCPDDGMPG